jgi:CBS domain-containing protein
VSPGWSENVRRRLSTERRPIGARELGARRPAGTPSFECYAARVARRDQPQRGGLPRTSDWREGLDWPSPAAIARRDRGTPAALASACLRRLRCHAARAVTIERDRRMAKQVRELMSKQPIKLQRSVPVIEAARQMRAANVGAVIVEDGGRLCGIVTDRDITLRAVAEGRDVNTTPLSDVCTSSVTTLSPDDDLDRAIQVMREKAVRRLLVVDSQNKAVGMLSLGDLAMDRDARSVLGQISAAPPNN